MHGAATCVLISTIAADTHHNGLSYSRSGGAGWITARLAPAQFQGREPREAQDEQGADLSIHAAPSPSPKTRTG